MQCSENSKIHQTCCKVESVVTVDERGQMILPKDIREKANIKAGDKLALLSWGEANDVSCIALVKVNGLNKLVQKMLQPVFDETIK